MAKFQQTFNAATLALVIGSTALFGFGLFVLGPIAYAALSCTVSTSCADTTIFKMYATDNSHAELASQSNYTQLVCCSGAAGLGTNCSGNFGVVLKLSGVTNAHVEENTQSNYANDACLSATGVVTIAYQNSNCTGYDTTVASISGTPTNAHVGDGTKYTRKVCATVASGSITMTASSSNSFDSASTYQFTSQTSTMSNIGAIQVDDSRGGSPGWTLAMTAQDWGQLNSQGGPNPRDHQLDYDGTGSDGNLGKLCPKPNNGNLYAQTGSMTGVAKGSNQCYSATISSINLASATPGNGTGVYWLTDVPAEQFIPSSPTAPQNITTTIVLTAS